MAFGFPAYHEETLQLGLSKVQSQNLTLSVLKKLNYPFSVKDENTISGTFPGFFLSMGYRFTILVLDDGSIFIRSTCPLPTQCFDFGVNQKNVESLIKAFTSA